MQGTCTAIYVEVAIVDGRLALIPNPLYTSDVSAWVFARERVLSPEETHKYAGIMRLVMTGGRGSATSRLRYNTPRYIVFNARSP